MHIITPLKPVDFNDFAILWQKVDGRSDMVEIWLDGLENWEAFMAALEDFDAGDVKLLGVCKSMSEGGSFEGDMREKSLILDAFLKAGGDIVDLDIARNPMEIMLPIAPENLWLSFHDYEKVPLDLYQTLMGMKLLTPAVYKFAVTPRDQSELNDFLEFIEDFPEDLKGIFTTMGPLGLEGRQKIGGRSWGGFYALDEAHKTAEGQPTLDDL